MAPPMYGEKDRSKMPPPKHGYKKYEALPEHVGTESAARKKGPPSGDILAAAISLHDERALYENCT